MRAIDVARGPLVVARPESTLGEAARLMAAHHVDAVVVTDGGRPVGVATERDLVVRGLAGGMGGDALLAAVMTPDPITVDARADAATAYRLLRDRNLHRLPVVADGRLVATLTLDDFAVEPPAGLTRLVHEGAAPEGGSPSRRLRSVSPERRNGAPAGEGDLRTGRRDHRL